MSLRIEWQEQDLLVIESVVDGEVVASVTIEEAGDAVRKVLHIQPFRQDDHGKVVVHA